MRVIGRPETFLAGTFFALILLGTLLLALPVAHARGRVGLLDALFTSTSAVCVTGLTVVDTGTDFSRLGHVVILGLFQLGGLGIMTFAALAAQIIGGRLPMRQQALVADVFYQSGAATRLRADLKRIVGLTLLFELIGALLIYADMRDSPHGHSPAFSAVFHSVSAFCNAGFSLYRDSLVGYRAHPVLMFTIMALIVLGGLGHSVVLEALRRARRFILRRLNDPLIWTLHSRVVLLTSAALILGGALLMLLFGLPHGESTWGERLLGAIFQSVTARTAGFNTVDIGALPMASLLVLTLLMFIGGSPGSCAGGIKTTSFVTTLAQMRSRLKGDTDVYLLGRRLPEDVIARAMLVLGLAVVWNVCGCFVLAQTEGGRGMPFLHLLFEQVSAFATVGLSTGITPDLSAGGKLWIIATMFLGRVGPLTMAMMVATLPKTRLRYTEERVMIG